MARLGGVVLDGTVVLDGRVASSKPAPEPQSEPRPAAAVAPAAGAERHAASDSPLPEKILRFVRTERLLHWAIALPFLGCLASAIVLVLFYNSDPTRPYRHVFAWTHRGCGAALLVLPSLVLLTSGRYAKILLYNVRQALGWTVDDIKWLLLMGPSVFSKRVVLPDQGKFNAAEKLNFIVVMLSTPLMIASGIAIWLPDYTSLDPLAPWIFHCALAALATPLIFGHMFMATINPDTRVGLTGMITGWVSREWAAHHYARWYREHFPHLLVVHQGRRREHAEPPAAAPPEPPEAEAAAPSSRLETLDDDEPIDAAEDELTNGSEDCARQRLAGSLPAADSHREAVSP